MLPPTMLKNESAPNNSSITTIAPIIKTIFTIGVIVVITPANAETETYELKFDTAAFRDDNAIPVASKITSTTKIPIANNAKSCIAFLMFVIFKYMLFNYI